MAIESIIPSSNGSDSLESEYQRYLRGNSVSLPGNAPLMDDIDGSTKKKLSFETWVLFKKFVDKHSKKLEDNQP